MQTFKRFDNALTGGFRRTCEYRRQQMQSSKLRTKHFAQSVAIQITFVLHQTSARMSEDNAGAGKLAERILYTVLFLGEEGDQLDRPTPNTLCHLDMKNIPR
ncbi:hypothetical protein H7849_06335 [Alloacidobacterium dinghuense]|uniref:Uncharacterized protein n=1 Tax=Alloacidobacterium dinghuense TaxID=2763107 RepID=A0A7G8BLY8_9BACT|nr:hypothetical protein [Alloacidobacterium dinghuense]QNI33558.1 hypothetical protein H7849_06335 [Alloacidobacterium dinghuense]